MLLTLMKDQRLLVRSVNFQIINNDRMRFLVISGIIKVEVSRRLRLITLTEILIIPDITKTESNNCFIILYLQVISQFLAGSMKRIEKPFLLCCPQS